MDATRQSRQSRHPRASRRLAAVGALSCALTLATGVGAPPRPALAMARTTAPDRASMSVRSAAHGAAAAPATTVLTWGDNSRGQLGTGDDSNRSAPTAVRGLKGVIAIAAGAESSLALSSQGSVWAWGDNDKADLGVPTSELCGSVVGAVGGKFRCSTTPTAQGLTGVTALAVASDSLNGMALKSDGTVWAWGQNNDGQVGDGTTNDAVTPVPVQGLSNVTAIAQGGGFSLALERDGTVWSWGSNDSGQLGIGQASADGGADLTAHPHPTRLAALGNIVAIAAGNAHALALTADGRVYAWGEAFQGALGLSAASATTNQPVPLQAPGLAGIKAIAAGNQTSLALATDGSVWAWGDDQHGELDRAMTDASSPQRVAGLSGITAIAAGGYHDVALDANGSVWGWGEDGSGQVGVPATSTCGDNGGCVTAPMHVPGVTGATAIAAGSYHTMALLHGTPPSASSPTAPSTTSPTAPSAPRTYVDPARSYALAYPASWVSTPTKGFDLFLRSPNQNIVLATGSMAIPNPGPARIKQDLPAFVKSFGTPLGAPRYTTTRRKGAPLYFGLSAYSTPQGKVGVALVEEVYGHHRLCFAVGLVRDATSPAAKTDLTTAVTVLTSLTLNPA